MKTQKMLIALLLATSVVFAQDAQVPAVVKASFARLHPEATNVKWEKEGRSEYEIGFKEKGTEISVVMDDKGNLKETETTIPISELPASIAPYIEKNYAGYKIDDAAKIVGARCVTTYEAGISKGKSKKDVMFDSDGVPLTKN